MAKKSLTFMMAMKDFFGLLPEMSLPDFMKDVRRLSDEERKYFQTGLEANGYEIVAPSA
jgi:hypothetical protein